MIEALNKRLEERYIQYCDMTVPVYWVCATIARLIISKLWLMVHHPMSRQGHGAHLTQDTRTRLFMTSIEVIEFSRLLETHENTSKWGWLFRTYMQWHAVAFVLSELCVRPPCPGVDRAWCAVNSVYEGWELKAGEKKGMLWKPMGKLMQKAEQFRAAQQAQLQAEFGSTGPPAPCQFTDTAMSEPAVSTPTTTTQYPDPISQGIGNPGPQSQQQQPSSSDLDIDLSKGLPTILGEIMPGGFRQASQQNFNHATNPNINNINTNPTPSTASDPNQPGGSNVPQWLNTDPNSVASFLYTAPAVTNQDMFPEQQLPWSEWDQVVRSFQMDVEQLNGPPPVGDISDWFE
jgi:hypothetical protein